MNYKTLMLNAITVIALSAGKAEAQGIGMSGGIGLTDRGVGMGIELSYVPRHRSNVQPQFQQLTYPRHNSNQFHQQPRLQYQYPGHFVQPQFVPQTPQFFQQPPTHQPLHYRTWPHPDEIMQAQAEELTLPAKTLEYGFYRTLIERPDRCDIVGGLENMFKMQPATPGYFIPNNEQVTSWNVVRAGVYELYAGGNDWRLRLGTVQLNNGDKIKFVKIAPIIPDYSQPPESQNPIKSIPPISNPPVPEQVPTPAPIPNSKTQAPTLAPPPAPPKP